MYGPKRMQSMVLELNASDERGIDVVRNQIKTFASTQQIFANGVKLVILDEVQIFFLQMGFSNSHFLHLE
jgi:replication factor C subunit 3/5